MAVRDTYHEIVVQALQKDGWTITDDPLSLKVKGTRFYIDLGAKKLIGAKKGKQEIAIEIKTFAQQSLLYAFYEASGQYMTYRDALKDLPEHKQRLMYLAITADVYERFKESPFLMDRINNFNILLIVVDIEKISIIKWSN